MKKISLFIILVLTILSVGCKSNDINKMENVYLKLFDGINVDKVTDDLTIPKFINGVEIEWTSSNSEVINNNGEVNRIDENIKVVIHIKLKYKGRIIEKEKTLTVLKSDSNTAIEIKPFYPEAKNMDFLQDKLVDENETMGISSLGTSNALIIPVEFTDYKFSNIDLERLDKAFFGTSDETGWESVQTFYQKSSYNNYKFDGEILEPYNTNKLSTYYATMYKNGYDPDFVIIEEALNYYDNQIDYSEYDVNSDGYIDGIYIIFSTPVYYGYNDPVNINDSDLWWAYVYKYSSKINKSYDGVKPNYYLWAGFDFIDEPLIYGERIIDDVYVNINATTYIHETGHLLGLDDYYDYNEYKGPHGGVGGADMMDFGVGDHSPFSKIILGWTTPLVVTKTSSTITINPFVESGDVILVIPEWNNTYFDEYFLIDFYTPEGLNHDQAGYNGLFSESGIRIYHVNAIIDSSVGSPKDSTGYYSIFSYNNSDTKYKLLSIVEADSDSSIEKYWYAEDDDLFQTGDIFGEYIYPNYRLYNQQEINFSIEINEITENSATVTITFD